MKGKKKILHIIKGLGRGGAEILLLETLRVHDNEKYEFEYVYFLSEKNHLEQELTKFGGRVTCLQRDSNLEIILTVRKLLRFVKMSHPDIIHAHMPLTGVVSRIVGRLLGIPVVYTEHYNLEKYNPATVWLNKLNYNWNDVVIAVSKDAENAIRNTRFKGELITILNATNTSYFSKQNSSPTLLSIEGDKIVIGTIAVFRKQKQLDKWLGIAKSVIEHRKDVLFFLIGDGPERENLERLTNELGISEFVVFTGLVENTRDYLNLIDVYMMTSEFEGLPVALLEAMSMECIPVVTPVGGIPDLISDSKTGFYIDADNPKKSAEVILHVLGNLQSQRQVGVRARDLIVEKYSIYRMVKELEDVYSSV